jgi:hypothetical protein
VLGIKVQQKGKGGNPVKDIGNHQSNLAYVQHTIFSCVLLVLKKWTFLTRMEEETQYSLGIEVLELELENFWLQHYLLVM